MGSSQPAGSGWAGGPVELDRVVPPSGNMILSGKQFWLGPVRAGQVVRFRISVDLIHLFIGGTRVKTVRSHLSVTDLARLVTQGAQRTRARRRCPRSSPGTRSRSSGSCRRTATSASPARSCSLRRPSAADGSGSGSSPTC